MNKNITLKSLFDLLEQVKLSDKARIRNRLLGIKKISDQNKQEKALQQIAKTIEQSIANKKLRLTHLPKISYPEG
jgi:ATP-dependent helicase HrpA